MHPIIHISINGKPVTGVLLSRLISVTVTDKEGTGSDTIDLELDAGAPMVSIPRKNDIIRCWMGYAGGTPPVDMGTFTADEPTLHCLPYKLQVQGKSADIRGKIKEHREKHWDDTTFGDVVKELASESGLTAQVSPKIAAFKGRDGYFAIEGESPQHYINRMAQRLGGIMTVKQGRLLIQESGSGQTVLGNAMPSLVVTPPMIIEDTCQIKFSYRERHKNVRAAYHDQGQAKRKFANAPSDPEGEADFTLRHQYANKDEAQMAADAKAKQLQREADTTQVEIEGNPHFRGGGEYSYGGGVHPEVDGIPWIIETATHKYDKGGGYSTGLSGKGKGGA